MNQVGKRALRLLAVVAFAVACGWMAQNAHAAEVVSFSAGVSDSRAGARPDANTTFELATELSPDVPANGPFSPCLTITGECTVVKGGAAKSVVFDIPPGLVGNPRGLPYCLMADLDLDRCPGDTQVGVAYIGLLIGGAEQLPGTYGVYNMAPARGEAAQLGIRVSAANSFVSLKVVARADGTYGLRATSDYIFTGLPFYVGDITIWGVPADPSHDYERRCNGVGPCSVSPGFPVRPFLANGAECGVPAVTGIRASTYQQPDVWSSAMSAPTVLTGCDDLEFEPLASVAPSSSAPDAPTGLSTSLSFDHHWGNRDALEAPPLKDAVVRFPEGLSINPSSADGLDACTDAQLGLGTDDPIGCPNGSRIGSVTATTPVLEERLTGGVYVRSQASDDPESGEMFRVALVVENAERGVLVKLPGRVFADARTGRLEARFADNPQFPVSNIDVRLDGGPRASLATPASCGTKAAEVDLASWGGQAVALTSQFDIDCPGGERFAPSFEAGAVSPVGGGFSPFVARILRPDRDQSLSGVRVDLPKGLIAKLRGVPLCGSVAAEHGGCPAGSRIGTATVGAGAGSSPFYLQGDAYLTEGYKGAPYGMAVHVHAKAGPFDLGWVRVRQALHVDPETAQIAAVSDPLPQIVKGVPVRLRDVAIEVDRPQFAINPTSCSEKQVAAALTSIAGANHDTASRFQVGDCAGLRYDPRLSMRLSGRRQTKTGGHPALSATLRQPPGQANTALARVTLPKSIALDAVNSYDPKLVCDYDASLKADCPQSTVIGKATAHTPVLNKPLTGAVHLVQGIKFGPTGNRIRTTPSLLVKLRGEVAINLRARSDVRGGRLVTTFPQVPDAPVSRFDMRINGGKKGILVVTRTRKAKINLCAGRQTADVQTDGHNGRQADYRTTVKTPCTKQARRAARKALRAKR